MEKHQEQILIKLVFRQQYRQLEDILHKVWYILPTY